MLPCVHAGFPTCSPSPVPHPARSRARLCPLSHTLHHGARGLPVSSAPASSWWAPNQTDGPERAPHSSAEPEQPLPSTFLLTQPKPPLTSGPSWSPSCPQGLFYKAASSSNPRAGLVFASAEHHRVPITLLLQPVTVPLKSRPVTSLLHLASPRARL